MQPQPPDLPSLPPGARPNAAAPPPRSPWLWCVLCERAYARAGDAALQPCPHDDCRGHAATLYAWDWNRTRRLHPEYPAAPAPGRRYPLLPS